MSRNILDIQKDLETIKSMVDGEERLGFELSESNSGTFCPGDSYEDIGRNFLSVVEKYPNHLNIIEDVVASITGYDLDSIRQHMIDHKDYYDAL